VLVQTAFLVFAFCGVLSLIVDIGFARLTQGQLQNAADSAAIEGLRKRDITVANTAGLPVNDPFASDCLRRAAANRMVRWTFDDDFDRDNGDGGHQLGGGPQIDVSNGVTSMHALATISIPQSRTYKPELQLNQRNVAYGDMVSGRFCYTDEPEPSEGGTYELQDIVCTEPQHASGRYSRSDFNPNTTSPNPPNTLDECPAVDDPVPSPWPVGGTGSLTGVDDSAFLVRLRRSNEFREDVDAAPGEASSGPALPLVFGRGGLAHGDDPASAYSIRRDGLTVRATAIADVRPALQVGLPQAGQLGVTPFTLVDSYVATLTAAAVQVTIDPARGIICGGLICIATSPTAGRFVDSLTDPTRRRWLTIATVGAPLPVATPLVCPAAATSAGYVPVYSLMASGANRIIGFSRLTFGPDPARLGNPCAKVLVRSISMVATNNASAALTRGLSFPVTASAADVRELFDKNRVRAGRLNYLPVLAPVLAR
jgi:hypothetical protein